MFLNNNIIITTAEVLSVPMIDRCIVLEPEVPAHRTARGRFLLNEKAIEEFTIAILAGGSDDEITAAALNGRAKVYMVIQLND